jgi:hypothetical protein
LNTKTILARNIGVAPAKFKIAVQEPFSVTPDFGCILPGELAQVDLKFFSKVTLINKVGRVFSFKYVDYL